MVLTLVSKVRGHQLTRIFCSWSTVWFVTLLPLISAISSPSCKDPGEMKKPGQMSHTVCSSSVFVLQFIIVVICVISYWVIFILLRDKLKTREALNQEKGEKHVSKWPLQYKQISLYGLLVVVVLIYNYNTEYQIIAAEFKKSKMWLAVAVLVTLTPKHIEFYMQNSFLSFSWYQYCFCILNIKSVFENKMCRICLLLSCYHAFKSIHIVKAKT